MIIDAGITDQVGTIKKLLKNLDPLSNAVKHI